MLYWANKDPDDTVIRALDWSKFLTSSLGVDTIVSVVWTVPIGMTKVSESVSTVYTIIKISGGVVGEHYVFQCRMTTAGGEQIDQSVTISIANG